MFFSVKSLSFIVEFIGIVEKARCISTHCFKIASGIEPFFRDCFTFNFKISFLTFAFETSLKAKWSEPISGKNSCIFGILI